MLRVIVIVLYVFEIQINNYSRSLGPDLLIVPTMAPTGGSDKEAIDHIISLHISIFCFTDGGVSPVLVIIESVKRARNFEN